MNCLAQKESDKPRFSYLADFKTKELISLRGVERELVFGLEGVAPEVIEFHKEKLRAIEETIEFRDPGGHGFQGG